MQEFNRLERVIPNPLEDPEPSILEVLTARTSHAPHPRSPVMQSQVQKHSRSDRIATRHPKGNYGPSLQGDKYREMRTAIFRVLNSNPQGIELSKMLDAVKPFLSEDVYGPGSLTSWYCVNVELDLEAQGQIERLLVGQTERLRRTVDA